MEGPELRAQRLSLLLCLIVLRQGLSLKLKPSVPAPGGGLVEDYSERHHTWSFYMFWAPKLKFSCFYNSILPTKPSPKP